MTRFYPLRPVLNHRDVGVTVPCPTSSFAWRCMPPALAIGVEGELAAPALDPLPGRSDDRLAARDRVRAAGAADVSRLGHELPDQILLGAARRVAAACDRETAQRDRADGHCRGPDVHGACIGRVAAGH